MTEEEQDPQDGATLSEDMAEPAVEQQTVKVNSVYEGLVEIGRLHGTVYGTNKKRADMMRFDLSGRSVFLGHTFIVRNGVLVKPILETAAVRVDMSGLQWLNGWGRMIDPQKLFDDHYLSRPNGSEKYMACNFPAKDVDELTDDEIAAGMPRNEARVRLEAWILCAALDGTLERYVTSKPTYRPGSWWWSPQPDNSEKAQLVIKAEWWQDSGIRRWTPNGVRITDGKVDIATVHSTNPVVRRNIQAAPELLRLCKTLSHELFSMQMRFKCHDADPLVCEANRTVEYVETGKTHE